MKRNCFGALIFIAFTMHCCLPVKAAALRILILGNSYTDSGTADQQVWQQVQNFLNADAEFAGTTVTRYAPGGYQLYNHANDATSTNLVKSLPTWDYIILQDQSYTPSHAWLYGGAWWSTFANGIGPLTRLAKTNAAKVIYYQTWARAAGETGVLATDYGSDPVFMQDNLSAAYNYAATYFGVKVAPVGEAWEKSLQLSPSLILHQSDLSHMNNRGAYLAAAVFYKTITGKNPVGVSYTGTLTASDANTLRANFNALSPQPNLAIDPLIPNGQVFTTSTLATNGTALGVIQANAIQPPSTNGQTPVYSIVRYEVTAGNAGGLFAVNPVTGALRLATAPVAGTNALTVRVTDSNNWQTNNTVQVVVRKHPYHAWAETFPALLGQTDPGLDPDHDGVVNAAEFAFGGRPDQAGLHRVDGGNLYSEAVVDGSGRLTLSYYRRIDAASNGLQYTVQFNVTPNPGGWHDAGSVGYEASESVMAAPNGFERATVTLLNAAHLGAANMFGRMQVRLLP